MSARQPPYDPRPSGGNSSNNNRSSSSSNRHQYGQGQSNPSTSNRPGQGSPNYGRTSQGFSMRNYLDTPQRHETWDWETKTKKRTDKNTRL
ncbi:hypothetical protein V8C35DRAFT_280241 [Trichoderma chlorosporum]